MARFLKSALPLLKLLANKTLSIRTYKALLSDEANKDFLKAVVEIFHNLIDNQSIVEEELNLPSNVKQFLVGERELIDRFLSGNIDERKKRRLLNTPRIQKLLHRLLPFCLEYLEELVENSISSSTKKDEQPKTKKTWKNPVADRRRQGQQRRRQRERQEKIRRSQNRARESPSAASSGENHRSRQRGRPPHSPSRTRRRRSPSRAVDAQSIDNDERGSPSI